MSVLSMAGRAGLFLLVGQPLNWIILATLLEKRKSSWFPFVWMAVQAFVAQIVFGIILQHYCGDADWFLPFASVVKIGMFILSVFVLCYLFNCTLLRLIFADIIAEALGSSFISGAVIAINILEKRENILDYGNELQWMDFGIIPLAMGAFTIVYFPLRTLLKKISNI